MAGVRCPPQAFTSGFVPRHCFVVQSSIGSPSSMQKVLKKGAVRLTSNSSFLPILYLSKPKSLVIGAGYCVALSRSNGTSVLKTLSHNPCKTHTVYSHQSTLCKDRYHTPTEFLFVYLTVFVYVALVAPLYASQCTLRAGLSQYLPEP
ncbi:hypothetical protein CHS0354_017602 [Potamilus streckersoni]|uniref:Uncharacterized protein n=1 Tax=Potamilus streckersoni TaxID=2493646 RepID=A0AAE0RPI1_9BIVA|nr:hypothetical protein CHS0354_017602 [Potamilus streckersoni]